MSESKVNRSQNTTNLIGGARKISGVIFTMGSGQWESISGDLIYRITPNPKRKCVLVDTRDGSEFPFRSVVAAKAFAKRRRHGRTLEEHKRAELLQATRERMKWGVKDLAEKIGVSPRTVEAYFSGVRVVPERLVEIEV